MQDRLCDHQLRFLRELRKNLARASLVSVMTRISASQPRIIPADCARVELIQTEYTVQEGDEKRNHAFYNSVRARCSIFERD